MVEEGMSWRWEGGSKWASAAQLRDWAAHANLCPREDGDALKTRHRLGYSRVCVRQVLVEVLREEITQPFTERLRGYSFMNVAF